MSNNTNTPAAATVAPAGDTKRAAAATVASEKLAAALAAAKGARDGVIVKRYGADVTPAAVALAKRAADEMSGASKSRGGARARVLAVVAGIADDVVVTDAVVVAAALSVLAAHAKSEQERRDRKRALTDAVNDASSSLTARAAALDVLAGMDDADADAKRATVRRRVADVLAASVAAGLAADDVARMLADAYGVGVSVDYPAAVPADAETLAAA
jgi:hypothetical protein